MGSIKGTHGQRARPGHSRPGRRSTRGGKAWTAKPAHGDEARTGRLVRYGGARTARSASGGAGRAKSLRRPGMGDLWWC